MIIKKGKNKFYIGQSESQAEAEMTFIVYGSTYIVEHTYVSESLRGQGVAGKLLDALLEYAKNNNIKIKPVCSYVVSAFE